MTGAWIGRAGADPTRDKKFFLSVQVKFGGYSTMLLMGLLGDFGGRNDFMKHLLIFFRLVGHS